jgi:cytoskeletal protein CcmA (bactofilin family)
MFGRRKQNSTRIDTLLGKSATLNGDLEFAGGLHLDGRVNGNVRSSAEDGGALSVSESGFIEGSVEVTNIVMNGTVNGDMHARERLVLGGKARVNGNVHYGVIEMAPGAVITGKLIPLGDGRGNGAENADTPAESTDSAQADPEVATAKSRA